MLDEVIARLTVPELLALIRYLTEEVETRIMQEVEE